jgi:DNA primase
MAASTADKAIEYAGYARHCLRVVGAIPARKDRIIHREMAAEWLRLADQAATATLGAQDTRRTNRRIKG